MGHARSIAASRHKGADLRSSVLRYPGGLALQHQFAYRDLLDALLQTRIGGVTVEFARSDLRSRRAQGLPRPAGHVSDASIRATRRPERGCRQASGAQALRHLDPQRLLLAPDCGLMRSAARSPGEVAVMIEAAAQLRREL